MTPDQAKKIKSLAKTTQKYLSRVEGKVDPVFAFSAAKYYPVLKKLASR